MDDLETFDGLYEATEDEEQQASVLPLATRMRMAADDDQLQRPNYIKFDDALLTSYDEIMSRQTKRQAEGLAQSAESTTSNWKDIIRDTAENGIVSILNKPERTVLAIGNYMTREDSPIERVLNLTGDEWKQKVVTVGQKWANWANESINDFVDRNMASQRRGDPETWWGKATGAVLSAVEYMATGAVWSPLASISMGIDIMGQATQNDIDNYIAETGDTALTNYRADWKDIGINFLNVGAQLLIEDNFGFGRVLKAKTLGANEFLAGFIQEFFQGELEDIAEAAKGNQRWEDVWNGVVSNIKDGVVGAFLQGPLGLAAHHRYASVAEGRMKDFFVNDLGMDERAAAQKAHDMRIRMEKEIAPLLVKSDKDLYDLVMQKGVAWEGIYSTVLAAVQDLSNIEMSQDELNARANEIASNLASQLIEAVVKNGVDLDNVQVGYDPTTNEIFVADTNATINLREALREIDDLDKPAVATKEEVEQIVEEKGEAEQKKAAQAKKPVSAIDPKKPFNKTKTKSPVFKKFQQGVKDGTIKMNRAEKVRYSLLLRDKLYKKPTTNLQMDNFAQKMVAKYMPTEITPIQQVSEPAPKQTVREPNKYDTGEKKVSALEKRIGKETLDKEIDDVGEQLGEYRSRKSKEAVMDAMKFIKQSDENLETALDAVMNMKDVGDIRPFEMFSALYIIATEENRPLLFEQLRQSPIYKGVATQQGQDISALQFMSDGGMINIMKVVNSLENKMAQKEEKNKQKIKKATKELETELNNIQYTDDEVINAIEKLEC